MIKIGNKSLYSHIAFADRAAAGIRLLEFVDPDPGIKSAVLAVPRGGVPVAKPFADYLDVKIQLVLTRKLPVPDSPEAGFGAVAIDGSFAINERLLEQIDLSDAEIAQILTDVSREIERRAQEYLHDGRLPEVAGRRVYMIDDGLASGYTMIAGAKMVEKLNPEKVILAVPVSPAHTIDRMVPYFDDIYCLYTQAALPFGVASFYEDFHDLPDSEVREILRR